MGPLLKLRKNIKFIHSIFFLKLLNNNRYYQPHLSTCCTEIKLFTPTYLSIRNTTASLSHLSLSLSLTNISTILPFTRCNYHHSVNNTKNRSPFGGTALPLTSNRINELFIIPDSSARCDRESVIAMPIPNSETALLFFRSVDTRGFQLRPLWPAIDHDYLLKIGQTHVFVFYPVLFPSSRISPAVSIVKRLELAD